MGKIKLTLIMAVLLAAFTALWFGTNYIFECYQANKEGIWEAEFYCDFPASKEEMAEDIVTEHWYKKQPDAFLGGFKSVDCAEYKYRQEREKSNIKQQASGLATVL